MTATGQGQRLETDDPFGTAERRELAALAARFTADRIVPRLEGWEHAGEVPRDLHEQCAALGLLGLGFDEEVGGSGGDAVDVAVLTEAMIGAGASGGLMAALFTHGIALPHVVDAATGAAGAAPALWLGDAVVRPVLEGRSILALGVTEPDGGSDVARLRTRAVRDGDDWVIDGAKTYITSGARADHVVVAARTGGEGAAGISLLLVPTDATGFVVGRRLAKMGWRCSDTAELTFDGVRVPSSHLLGVEGGGFASLARHFATERLSISVQAYATAARCLDLTLDWVNARETFGRRLVDRQVVQHTLVEMYRQIDVARVYSRAVAVRHAAGQPVIAEAALAKHTAVEACTYVVDRAVQLHGGLGYMEGTEVERHYRDSRVLGIGGGATEVMTDLLARLLPLRR
jgi:acyl-CoA dehydrogenase